MGGMKAKKVLLLTPLLKWYLDHGLEVTEVYQVIEFSPQASFKEFREKVKQGAKEMSPQIICFWGTQRNYWETLPMGP